MPNITGITHWALRVNNLEESERFYTDVVGLEPRGRLNDKMSCFTVCGLDILLCEQPEAAPAIQPLAHHSFTFTPFRSLLLPTSGSEQSSTCATWMCSPTRSYIASGATTLAASSISATHLGTAWSSVTRPGSLACPRQAWKRLWRLSPRGSSA
jgi:hypothetical protein